MNTRSTIASLVVIGLAACGVYVLKYQVRQFERELTRLEYAAASERRAIQNLRAEWAFLTRPERLASLAAQHLDLRPAQPYQIVSIDRIARRRNVELAARSFTAVLPSGDTVPWRLKPVTLTFPVRPRLVGR
jgi:cell division protein FtsL